MLPLRSKASSLSCTLAGYPFSIEHHHFLLAVARARQWKGNVWVPTAVVELLGLTLLNDHEVPVQLPGARTCRFFYHSSRFSVPVHVLQERWDAHQRSLLEVDARRAASLLASQVSPEQLPLTTNGERFDSDTEERLLGWLSSGKKGRGSPYWATPAEASFIFDTPFKEEYLNDPANGVVSYMAPLCQPLTFYHVEGTVNPTCFSPEVCRRYDPVNFADNLYRPTTAMRMKAYAIHYGCLHETRWISTSRASRLGRAIPSHIKPLEFFTGKTLLLVNYGTTYKTFSHRPRAAASPLTDAASENLEICKESPLLVKPEQHTVLRDAIESAENE